MTDVSEVLSCLMKYADMETFTDEQLTPVCERGLLWVYERLKPGADRESPLIPHTAAALAHYFFFLTRLTETDKYEAYTAGDMSVRRNTEKELKLEERIRDEAIAAASSILTDGGFFFCGS
ncbi:MAG: hypothetical protein IJB74_03900 [Clostridia bacterium]|nr:hypothetical protein [Clostridia bacterium]